MRLFIAIPIPKDIKNQLLRLRCDVTGVRWLEYDQLHLTLSFLGEVEGDIFKRVLQDLERIYHPSLDIFIKGVGHFGNNNSLRVLYAKVELSNSLKELQKKVVSLLQEEGLPVTERKFIPHITLARSKMGVSSDALPFLRDNSTMSLSFEAEEFVLFSSKLSEFGAKYKEEATYELGVI